jgi:RNA polymerase sigma-70 factor, ECF subfamily
VNKPDNATHAMTSRLAAESDEELFARIGKDGGEEAFRTLYERHAARIYAYCARILGSRDEAKDVFQESFIRFYRKALTPSGEMCVAPYLYTIARNGCISAIRARKDTVSMEEYAPGVEDRAFEQTERSGLVRLAIDLLPMEYREPLVLREYNDISYSDIAEIMSVPVSTVKIRIYRAKEKLRTILAPYFEER